MRVPLLCRGIRRCPDLNSGEFSDVNRYTLARHAQAMRGTAVAALMEYIRDDAVERTSQNN